MQYNNTASHALFVDYINCLLAASVFKLLIGGFFFRDRLLLFLNKLILEKENAAALIQANGVKILLDLVPLAHLHTSRAIMSSQSMAIEASAESTEDSQEKEW